MTTNRTCRGDITVRIYRNLHANFTSRSNCHRRCRIACRGDLFEHLIYKFAEASNEEAGEHYTPRDAIRLMVDLLFAEDNTALLEPGTVRAIYDPTFMRSSDVSRDTHLERVSGCAAA